MGYMHIENLYRNQTILMFRECYALEKLHGTSAHIRWSDGKVHFRHGGEKRENFIALFDESALAAAFETIGHPIVIEDVTREGVGEFVDSREARAAIGRKTAELFHAQIKSVLA